MNEPQGPLPPSVYRRRRVVAMAGLGVGAVLFIWVVGALLGGGDTPNVRGTANVRPDGVPLATGAPASNPPPTGQLSQSIDPSSAASASLSASASVSATTTTPVPTTTTVAPPTTCADSVLRVTVTSDKPTYQVGDHPLLTLHIANAGKLPCLRDVSHQLRSITVRSTAGKIIWSSSYCYQANTDELRLLQPEQALSYSVQWAGRTAAPGCPTTRTTVPAGGYEMVGVLGKLTGPASPLILTS